MRFERIHLSNQPHFQPKLENFSSVFIAPSDSVLISSQEVTALNALHIDQSERTSKFDRARLHIKRNAQRLPAKEGEGEEIYGVRSSERKGEPSVMQV
jgi:hypothetical protein